MKPKQSVLRVASVALGSAFAAAGVHAGDEARQPNRLFLQLDVNHDGDDRNQAYRAAQLASAVSGVERVENALKPK